MIQIKRKKTGSRGPQHGHQGKVVQHERAPRQTGSKMPVKFDPSHCLLRTHA